jgi:hypothetical protein
MLNVQLGNGARASGFCCLSIGDGATTRGAFQVEVRSNLSLPQDITEESVDNVIAQLNDAALTYKSMEEQEHAPKGFGVRSAAAISIAIDTLSRHKVKLQEKVKEEARLQQEKGKEELVSVVTECCEGGKPCC